MVHESQKSPGSEVFAGFARRDGWQLLRHLLGGAVILMVWVALWAWVAVGVVRPLALSAGSRASAALVDKA